MNLKKHPNGTYYAHITGAAPINLGVRSKKQAAELAASAKIAELETAAKIRALTAETVSRLVAGRNVTGANAAETWLTWAQSSGLAPGTVESYRRTIMFWLEKSGFDKKPVASATEFDVDAFVNDPESTVTAGTRHARLVALQSFFKVLGAKGLVIGNPAALVRVKYGMLSFAQKEPKVRVPFNQMELDVLKTSLDPFWRVAVLLAERYGLRLSDVVQLEWDQFDKPDTFVVWTDKRDRRIELDADEEVTAAVRALPKCHERYVFPDQREMYSDPRRRPMLSVYFSREAVRLGLGKGKSFHCIRHSFATSRAMLGDSVDSIRMKMGHQSTSTTQAYIHA